MIKSIDIKNFKCFKENKIMFSKANLLLGANSGGKSSLIQAILLSKMSLDSIMEYDTKSLDLMDNKYDLNLNSFDEIIYDDADEYYFNITLECNSEISTIKYTQTDDINVINHSIDKRRNKSMNPLIYLGSDRLVSKYQINGDINNIKIGKDNEYLGYIIGKGRQKNNIEMNIKRNHWDNKDTKLLDIQINDWLSYILPNSRVTSGNTGTDNYISLLFGEKSNLHQNNVGYGNSFILPIIVAGLIAKKGSILIVENPELHLHPRAQSNIAAFLSVVAASGVQVIIETHSEHIVNGFRKAILDKQNPLKDSDLIINYLHVDKICVIDKVELNDKAEIANWPEGFMDQEENDLFELRKMRLKR